MVALSIYSSSIELLREPIHSIITTAVLCTRRSPLIDRFSQDWNLLKSRAKNLAGRGEAGMRGITKAEVRQHKSQHDCWTIFRGKVCMIIYAVEFLYEFRLDEYRRESARTSLCGSSDFSRFFPFREYQIL